jgi:phosphoglycerate dehydrogenase-like enzyme
MQEVSSVERREWVTPDFSAIDLSSATNGGVGVGDIGTST